MKIRFLVSFGGNPGYEPGQIVDLPADRALGFADGVRAELVDPVDPSKAERTPDLPVEFEPPEDLETAEAVPAPEVAVTRRGRPRKPKFPPLNPPDPTEIEKGA